MMRPDERFLPSLFHGAEAMDFDMDGMAAIDRYKLITGLVVPRPIAFVSTMSEDGVANAAPFSFFNAFGASPPVVVLGINSRPTGAKDSYKNIVATGEFVINIATAAIAEQVNAASGDYACGVDEFDRTGLSQAPSKIVKPPRIAESPANLECRLLQALPLKGGPSALLIGEIVLIHVRDELLDGSKVDQNRLDAIGRMGGPVYSYTRDTFAMERPVVTGPDAL